MLPTESRCTLVVVGRWNLNRFVEKAVVGNSFFGDFLVCLEPCGKGADSATRTLFIVPIEIPIAVSAVSA